MTTFRTLTLIAATITTAMLAGVYYAFAVSVMPALGRADDRTLIDVMQKINVVIVNPIFMLSFLGAPLVGIAAFTTLFGKDTRNVLLWAGIAMALNIVGTGVSFALNIPLNDALDAAGDPSAIADPAAVRDHFETSWVAWNVARAVLHTLAFAVLCWALVQLGGSHAERALTHANVEKAPASAPARTW